MIATCHTASDDWYADPPIPQRTGSLRRIDDILGELLAGYAKLPAAGTVPPAPCIVPPAPCADSPPGGALGIEAGPPTGARTAYVGVPGAAVDIPPPADASPVESLLVCQH